MSIEAHRFHGGIPPQLQPVEGEPAPYWATPEDVAEQRQQRAHAQAELDAINELHRRAIRGLPEQLIRDPRTGQTRNYL